MSKLVPAAAVADDGARKRLVKALLHHAKGQGIGVEYAPTSGGVYDQKTRKVTVSPDHQGTEKGVSILAHELGHAEFDKSWLGRAVQTPLARAGAGVSLSIGALIALTAEGSLQHRLGLSTAAVALGQVPLLTGEGVAWYKGHRMLKEHGATPEQLARLRSDAVRYGSTYLQPAASGLGAALLLSAISHAANP